MNKKNIPFLFALAICTGITLAQTYDPLSPPNTYRNADNPNYWKNRLPYEGYWQQDVHYTIKANIDEQTDIIHGEMQLIYQNNSPDALDHVFFHLYQNAFQPGSYYDDLQQQNNVKPRYGRYEEQKLGTEIIKLHVDGQEVKSELDNTILKVFLPQPLKSGASITFAINFKTYYDNSGSVRRRMKKFNAFGYKHYDGVHWYPRITVYDRKFGWTTDQHLGREFYGDFGTYDVELTFANNFVVGATGFLLNRSEMLPPDLRQKLDIKNFAEKPWNEAPSVIIEYDAEKRKTWKYHAENVHDFAFTADPTYRIGEAECLSAGALAQAGNGIKCYALAQEPHASGWQNAAAYTAKVVKTYSEDFGMYVYHKMIVADARDGMEYPMLTLDGGRDPGHRGLFAHEVGHNWFFGQVGNNETYRAALDEGFTTFLTSWCMKKLEGDTIQYGIHRNRYLRKFKKPDSRTNARAYDIYLKEAIRYNDPALNTHSDGFNGALRHGGGYRQVYFKTAVMLYNLQYVLGDELFSDAMKNYFEQWKIAHPYFIDFRNSVIHYTKTDLNWFFDQWLETSKHIDYGIKSIKRGDEENEFLITFKRKGRMQMPIDFEITSQDGKIHKYYIPNTWFEKKSDATVLPKWTGWDKLKQTYTANVFIPGGIKNVEIDPSHRLADVYMLDNSSKLPVNLSFDHRLYNRSDFTKYEAFARPEIWYNGYDGFKTGMHLNGNYMEHLHKFDLTLWFNTGLLQHNWGDAVPDINQFDHFSYRFNYRTALDKYIRGASVFLAAKSLDGLDSYSFGMDEKFNSDNSRLFAYFKSMHRPDSAKLNYLLYPNEWNVEKFNNTINLGMEHHYKYRGGGGDIDLLLKSSTLGSDYDYSSIALTAVNHNKLGKLLLKTRTFFQYATAANIAPESQLYLAGANPEELMESKYTRAVGVVPSGWLGYGTTTNNFHAGGGLNLRGYAGYLAPYEVNQNEIRMVYKGVTGAAANVELEFNRLFRFSPPFLRNTFQLKTYLFGDAGIINFSNYYENLAFADLRVDAGIGTALTIKRWGPLQKVNPLTIRFDMPLFLNRIPANETEYFKFRWLLGISRAF